MPVPQLAKTGTPGTLGPEFWRHPSHLARGGISGNQTLSGKGTGPISSCFAGWDGQGLSAGRTQTSASRHRPTYHDAMMALRASRTSAAARRCWGSRTSSFRMRHTVFSDTRPSLMRERTRAQAGQAAARSPAHHSEPRVATSAPPQAAGLTPGWCTRRP